MTTTLTDLDDLWSRIARDPAMAPLPDDYRWRPWRDLLPDAATTQQLPIITEARHV